MRRIDWRTRSAGHVRQVNPRAFLEEEWPARLAETAELAARGAARLGLLSLGLEVEGGVWTLRCIDGRLRIEPGRDDAVVRVELERDAFCDLVDDHKSTLGLVIAGRARVVQGDADRFIAWEPVLRAALDRSPVYEPGSIDLEDAEGRPLALDRAFDPDDSVEEMRHFLAEAGYLRLRAVFTVAEMQAVAADLDRALADARPDDGSSWWVKTRSGEHRPSRILDFIEKSDALGALLRDERFLRIGRIPDEGHVHLDPFGEHLGKPSAEGLVKPLGVAEGISDLPWHKDCARGGHSRFCCGLTVGIAVTGAGAESGELRVVAGSHRANLRGSLLDPDLDLPRVDLPTATGDVSVHCSCTLHMARAPSKRERMVVYTGFGLPPRPGDRAPSPEVEQLERERADISRQAREMEQRGPA